MNRKSKVLAAVIAAGLVLIIISAFILTNFSTSTARSGTTSAHTNSPGSDSASSSSLEKDANEYVGSYKTDPVVFDLAEVDSMRGALLEAGYTPVNVSHPYMGCELFVITNKPTGMDVLPDGVEVPAEDNLAGDVGHEHAEDDEVGHTHSEGGFEQYNAFALLCGNGVKMALGDYLLDVSVLNDIRRADNGERIYPMISQEQADLAAEMWMAAEQIRTDGAPPERENAIILNGRMIPNTGFIIRSETLYLPIEKIAKGYCALAEVNEGRRTIIRYNDNTYSFYGSSLSSSQREHFNIENDSFIIPAPAGIDDKQVSYSLYSNGGYIEADTLAQVLGWQIEYHGGYVEIVSDPLDVNQNFAVLPEHDMKVLDVWFLNNDYTLYGWDEYTPRY